jgi:hypothetical protein
MKELNKNEVQSTSGGKSIVDEVLDTIQDIIDRLLN